MPVTTPAPTAAMLKPLDAAEAELAFALAEGQDPDGPMVTALEVKVDQAAAAVARELLLMCEDALDAAAQPPTQIEVLADALLTDAPDAAPDAAPVGVPVEAGTVIVGDVVARTMKEIAAGKGAKVAAVQPSTVQVRLVDAEGATIIQPRKTTKVWIAARTTKPAPKPAPAPVPADLQAAKAEAKVAKDEIPATHRAALEAEGLPVPSAATVKQRGYSAKEAAAIAKATKQAAGGQPAKQRPAENAPIRQLMARAWDVLGDDKPTIALRVGESQKVADSIDQLGGARTWMTEIGVTPADLTLIARGLKTVRELSNEQLTAFCKAHKTSALTPRKTCALIVAHMLIADAATAAVAA